MELKNEPSVQEGSCSYCGDAQISHPLYFLESLFATPLDQFASLFNPYVPRFVRQLADWIPIAFLRALSLFKAVKFSSDIEKASTFRSRVIWEEAVRRGIPMEQVVLFGKPLEHYRAKMHDKYIYFESLPTRPELTNMRKDWDDKVVLKQELLQNRIPVPAFIRLPFWSLTSLEKTFDQLNKPLIVKPRSGSRGRHTFTNIRTLAQFRESVKIARQISSQLIVEEHLTGFICRATLVKGVLAGFYRGNAAMITGDGIKTVAELIEEKDRMRPDRVEQIRITRELQSHVLRSGYAMTDVLPTGTTLSLSHRIGRLFGGTTREMLDEMHPSFIPILQKAERIVDLAVVGFDCIIPDPTLPADSQKWGIIECNTLPFIDLHYYALEGKPKNIAGMIWNVWNKDTDTVY